jgi:hypothetical protein
MNWRSVMDYGGGLTKRDNARLSMALASVEGQALGVPSANAVLSGNADRLRLYRDTDDLPDDLEPAFYPNEYFWLIADTDDPRFSWEYNTSYGNIYGIEILQATPFKGASREAIVAEFDKAHKALVNAGYGGYAALGAAGIPSGAMLAAIASHIDNNVSLFCYATIVLNFVEESIGGEEDFDAYKAQSEAARLCGINADPKSLAKKYASDWAREFVRSTVQGGVGYFAGSWASHWTGGNTWSQGVSDAATGVGPTWADDKTGATSTAGSYFYDLVNHIVN